MSDSKRILVAFDGSPQAQKAFDFALEVFKECQGVTREITVLSVVHLVEQIDVPMDIEPIVNAAKAQYEVLLTGLQEKAKSRGLDIAAEIVIGHPSEDIIEYAAKNKIDLIIMATHGRTGLAHVILGSVAERVVQHSPVPVVMVRPAQMVKS